VSCAVDSTVIIDLIGGTADTAERAKGALWNERQLGGVSICPPVYAECLAYPGWRVSDLDRLLDDTGIAVDWNISRGTWLDAALAFGAYAVRRRKSKQSHPRRILADFIIGAHAETAGGLITRKEADFRTAFPKLRLVVP
jgi:predicted nucleic acid-binding protein